MTAFDPEKITFFARTDARGQGVPFGIKARDRQRHMYVVGKTGMGKSCLLENMAAQDIMNGDGMAFIDPHGSAAETLLNYVPEHRVKDVVYFAPFDLNHPVSFNVMEDVGPDKRHLVVSGLMSTFKKIWVDAWSARMEYILTNALLALIEYPDTTLLSVNRLFSDKNYRERVVDYIKDPAVKSFWVDEFANYTDRFTADALPAIQNKVGQFTGNPLIRNIIGQPHSSFNIRELMDNQKILIMNLSKGLVGDTNANLLGSMLTTRIYLAAMSRADLPVEKMKLMPNFYFYVDEFQSFANATFADILSEARKYHLNLIIAHQYIEQMEEDVRNAVFGNVGTTIAFRVGPFDAEVLETVFAPRFEATDLVNLGFAQIYLTLMIDGIGSHPFSATTLPPIQPPPISCREMVIESSRKRYAKSRDEVEELVTKLHTPERSEPVKRSSDRRSPDRSGGGSGQSNYTGGGGGKRTDRPASARRSNDSPPRERSPRTEPVAENRPRSVDELRSVLAGLASKADEESAPKESLVAEVKKEDRTKPQPTTSRRKVVDTVSESSAPIAKEEPRKKAAQDDRSEEKMVPQADLKQPPKNDPSPQSKSSPRQAQQTTPPPTNKEDLRAALSKLRVAAETPTPVVEKVSFSPRQVNQPTTQASPDLRSALSKAVDQVEDKMPQPEVVKPVVQQPAPKPVSDTIEEQPVLDREAIDVNKIKSMLRQSDNERSPFGS